MTEPLATDKRVLILAPVGRDFQLADSVFRRHGVAAEACSSLAQLCSELDAGVGALLLMEEALADGQCLLRWVAAQPPWSDLPILLLARPGVDQSELGEIAQPYGNVTILERPTRVAALVSAVRSALRARMRQYQIREHLAQRAEAEEKLRADDRRKDEFLAILAHELRNPLAPISNGLQLLKLTRSEDPRVAALGEMMERQVANLKRLVDELLEVSRVTRGVVDLRCERVELSAVINTATEASQPLLSARRHRLELQAPAEPIYLHADPVRLGQILANILNNAAKYTDPGGHIRLSVRRSGGNAEIEVADNGVGIPPEDQKKIFDLFVQVERSHHRAQGGLGIGLTLAKRLVDLHNGSIEVYSAGHGCGSRFTVRLPLLSETPQAAVPSVAPGHEDLANFSVLVADDNSDAAASLGRLLEQLGASVTVVDGGLSALTALGSARMDAAIIDIGMPDLDGLEVARRIRGQAHLQNMALIALTGWGQAKDMEATRKAGFDRHLVKPPDLDSLVRCLQEVRQRPNLRAMP